MISTECPARSSKKRITVNGSLGTRTYAIGLFIVVTIDGVGGHETTGCSSHVRGWVSRHSRTQEPRQRAWSRLHKYNWALYAARARVRLSLRWKLTSIYPCMYIYTTSHDWPREQPRLKCIHIYLTPLIVKDRGCSPKEDTWVASKIVFHTFDFYSISSRCTEHSYCRAALWKPCKAHLKHLYQADLADKP